MPQAENFFHVRVEFVAPPLLAVRFLHRQCYGRVKIDKATHPLIGFAICPQAM